MTVNLALNPAAGVLKSLATGMDSRGLLTQCACIKRTTLADYALATNSVSASGTPANNATVVVGGQTYTFKTSLTPANGEVLINAQDASLTNLQHAINGTGGTPNTDYKVAGANAQVTAGAVASHAIPLTAIPQGVLGNALTLSVTGANVARGAATFSGGTD